MFIGHFALGLAASRAEKNLPLGTALFASQIPDALWPYFLLAGIETVAIAPGDTAVTPLRFESYPWSHSLLMVALWGGAAALAFRASGRNGRASMLVALLAISHWFWDVLTHRADMPVLPWGSLKVGLGLWNSVPLTVALESLMFAAAIVFYARDRKMGRGFWALMAFLTLTYVGNIVGPPPPSVMAVAVSMIVLMPLVWWWGNRAGSH